MAPTAQRPVLSILGLAVALVCTPGAFATASEPLYRGPFHVFGSGFYPVAVSVADLDGDGRAEIAVANQVGNTVTIHHGVGPGRWVPGAALDIAAPVAVSFAHLDGDGILDLVATGGPQSIGAWRGLGGGRFGSRMDFGGAAGASGLTLGDFDGDQIPDVAFVRTLEGSATVLLGNGDGTFSDSAPFATALYPVSLATTDLDGDGNGDLVVGSGGDPEVRLHRSRGDGTFDPPEVLVADHTPWAVAVSDLDGDGDRDIVTANLSAVTVSVLRRVPAGFDPHYDIGVGRTPQAIAVGDLDGDGRPDLVLANYQADVGISVLLSEPGTNPPSFRPPTVHAVGYDPHGLAVADVDADGRLDIVTANSEFNTIAVLDGNGDGSFGTLVEARVANGPVAVAAGDFDGNALPDLVTACPTGHALTVNLALPGGGYAAPLDVPVPTSPLDVAVDRIGNDAFPDVAFSSGSAVQVMRGSGGGVFLPPVAYDLGGSTERLAIYDLDLDGVRDVVVAQPGLDRVAALRGEKPGTLLAPAFLATGREPTDVAVLDLDGDDYPDLAVSHRFSSFVSVFPGNGDATFRPRLDSPIPGLGAAALAAGDLDGDHIPDIVAAGHAGPITVLRGRGDGRFDVIGTLAPFESHTAIALADLDGDGRLDLVINGRWTFDVAVYLGAGGGAFRDPLRFGVGYSPEAFHVGDLNGDGAQDIAVPVRGENRVVVLQRTADLVAAGDPAPVGATMLRRLRPNPMLHGASIDLELPRPERVRLRVFDALGRLVSTLLDADLPAGRQSVRWDAGGRKRLPAALYLIELTAGARRETAKAVVLE